MPILYTNDLSVTQLISLTNLARANAGLPPLTPDPLLHQAAQAKADEMLSLGYFSHTSVTDKAPWFFISDAGYQYSFAGENLARDYTSSADTIAAWLNSPSHKDNLLNPVYQDIGMAITTGDYPDGKPTTIVVQLFAKPASSETSGNPSFISSDILFPAKSNLLSFALIISVITLGILGWFILKKKRFRKRSKKNILHPDLWLH